MAATTWVTIASGNPGPAGFKVQGVVFDVYVIGPSGPLADSLGVPTRVQCMWDTGSDVSSVDARLLQDIGAPQVGSVLISTVQGTETVPTDLATLAIAPTDYPLSAGAIPVLADSLDGNTRVLIGRDLQSMYRLTCDGVHGTWRIEAPVVPGSVTTPPPPARTGLLVVGGVLVAAAIAITALEVA